LDWITRGGDESDDDAELGIKERDNEQLPRDTVSIDGSSAPDFEISRSAKDVGSFPLDEIPQPEASLAAAFADVPVAASAVV
jgi:hypothetical protein